MCGTTCLYRPHRRPNTRTPGTDTGQQANLGKRKPCSSVSSVSRSTLHRSPLAGDSGQTFIDLQSPLTYKNGTIGTAGTCTIHATHTTHHTRIPHQIHRQGWQSLLRALWWGCKAVSSPCRPTRLSPIGLMNWLKRQQQALHASLHQAKPVGSSSSLDHLRNAHLSDSTCMHHHSPRTDPDHPGPAYKRRVQLLCPAPQPSAPTYRFHATSPLM